MKSDAALRNIPVLGVSARPREIRAEELKQAGFDIDRDLAGYITKPFGPSELLNAVEAALRVFEFIVCPLSTAAG
jgi:CheY-like chemotaxis protein